MKDEKFDRLLSTIRNENVPEVVVTQARERVWTSITTGADSNPVSLRTCEDFQALIPGYLAKQLVPARALLFEDHVHTCVRCRHALDRKKNGELQPVWRLETKRSAWPGWRWAMATAAVAAVVVVALAVSNGLFPGQHPVRAAVQTVDGSIYAVDGNNVRRHSGGIRGPQRR